MNTHRAMPTARSVGAPPVPSLLMLGLLTLGLLAGCGTTTPTVTAPPPATQAAPPTPESRLQAQAAPVAAPEPSPAPAPPANGSPAQAAQTAPSGPLKVGLLVPLGGRDAALGNALTNAAQMALFDSGANIELLIHDTEPAGAAPDGSGAKTAAAAAVAQGAQVLIGPLFSAETRAVRAVAGTLPVLSFSNDAGAAAPGTWVLGLQLRDGVRRVAEYAIAHGLTRLALLAPVGGAGDAVEAALRQTVAAAHGEIIDVGRYQPNQRDISQVIRRLAALPPPPGWTPPPAPAPSANTSQADAPPAPPPPPPFQAIMIADGGQHLREVAPMLPFFDLDPSRIRFLGTGQWDEPGLGREPSLLGGWYAAPDPEGRAGFEKRYGELFGQAPPRLATLAYDAVSLVASLARQGQAVTAQTLADSKSPGYVGLDGGLRLLPDGGVDRDLAVLEVGRTGVSVAEPAGGPPTPTP